MIRLAKLEDLNSILKIYANARKFMAENGNPTQWGNGYPEESLLKTDIQQQRLYVVEIENEIHGVFMFLIGKDPTYAIIEGDWICEEEYGVIHRVASSGKVKGILNIVVEYCYEKCGHLRIDTHEDNHIMQKAILRNGFKRCGIIYLEDGNPRIAYEKI